MPDKSSMPFSIDNIEKKKVQKSYLPPKYFIIFVLPNTVATCRGVAPLGDMGSRAIANFRLSNADWSSLILPSLAAK